jgi:hypothetical protein
VVTEPVPGRQLLESDRNSSLTVLWEVVVVSAGRSQLTVRVSWQGATGIGGFFERRFAPAGIRRIYSTVLDRLQTAV